MYLYMTAPCLFGVEGLVSDELKQMGAENVCAENGRVFFEGDESILARANINSRFAERILIVLDRFKATTLPSFLTELSSSIGAILSVQRTPFPLRDTALTPLFIRFPTAKKS